MLQDRMAEIEVLEEEIALYKARSESLNRRLNDLKQKLIEYQEMEAEMCELKREFERKNYELRDAEDKIFYLECTLESQDRDMEKAKSAMIDLCRLQRELMTCYGQSGIEYVGDSGMCSDEVPLAPKRSITAPPAPAVPSAPILTPEVAQLVQLDDEELKKCNQKLEGLEREIQRLRSETTGGN